MTGFRKNVKLIANRSRQRVVRNSAGIGSTPYSSTAGTAYAALCRAKKSLTLHASATDIDPSRAALIGLSLAVKAGEGAYLPLSHRYLGAPKQVTLAEVREREIHIVPAEQEVPPHRSALDVDAAFFIDTNSY